MSKPYRPFTNDDESHAHSLQTLETLYQFDDFMGSVRTLVDMGCGRSRDLEWWATRTTRDNPPRPLNIKCLGIDLLTEISGAQRHKNISYHPQDFTEPLLVGKRRFDVIWCHDAFQYVIDPFATLRNWWSVAEKESMLVLILPQTTNLEGRVQAYDQRDGCYWNWTMVSLIHVLAVSGWDCGAGFFKKDPGDPWLHAVVYKSKHAPRDPRTTKWYDLCELGLLPESAVKSIQSHGYLRQRDLVLPWMDRSLTAMAQQ
jgi:hypothetical protein